MMIDLGGVLRTSASRLVMTLSPSTLTPGSARAFAPVQMRIALPVSVCVLPSAPVTLTFLIAPSAGDWICALPTT